MEGDECWLEGSETCVDGSECLLEGRETFVDGFDG